MVEEEEEEQLLELSLCMLKSSADSLANELVEAREVISEAMLDIGVISGVAHFGDFLQRSIEVNVFLFGGSIDGGGKRGGAIRCECEYTGSIITLFPPCTRGASRCRCRCGCGCGCTGIAGHSNGKSGGGGCTIIFFGMGDMAM
jgi:hypothetical protein